MGTFFKVVGVIALIFVGGCTLLLVVGGLTARKAAQDPQFQKALQSFPNEANIVVTLAEFNQITTGMTYDQVRAIIGADGTVSSTNTLPNPAGGAIVTTLYEWKNSDWSAMNAMFQGGQLMQKSQFNLE